MKKLIALLLVLVMAVSMVACGENPETTAPTTEPTNAPTQTPTEPSVQLPATALEFLQNAWTTHFNALPEEQKFPTCGGYSDNFEDMVTDNAGPIKLEMEGALYTLFVPEEGYANVEEASNIMNMMNGNTFTAGVMKLKEGTDIAAFVKPIYEALANNHWICGQPDRFVIASVGNYVVVMYGHDGVEIDGFKNGEIITPFLNTMTEMYPGLVVLHNELTV